MDAPPIQYARTDDGVNIAYAAWGTGSRVTWVSHTHPLVGALGEDLASRRPRTAWMANLGETHTALCYDGRGYGMSGRGIVDASLDAHVADLETVLAASGSAPTALFAFHWAAPIALTYAVRHPESVSSVVLWEPKADGRCRPGCAEGVEPLAVG